MEGRGCPCGGACTGEASDPPAEAMHAGDGRVTRSAALAAAAATIGLFLLDRVPGVEAAEAMRKKFHPPRGARKVGSVKRLRANSALATNDPATGRPAVVIRPGSAKRVVAYSAVCTHRGCTVRYDPARKLLVCPCHGSIFDPAHGAAVVSGPAPYALPSLKVAVDGAENIWLV